MKIKSWYGNINYLLAKKIVKVENTGKKHAFHIFENTSSSYQHDKYLHFCNE